MSTVDVSTAAQIARLTARQNAALAVLDELETAGPAVHSSAVHVHGQRP